MNALGITFRPRERRLAFAVAILVGMWAVVSWMLQPLWDRVHDLRYTVQGRRQKFEAMAQLVEQAPMIEQDYDHYAAYVRLMEEPEDRTVLNDLEELSRRSNVQLNLKPRAGISGTLGQETVEIDAEGALPNLLGFLDELLRLPRLVTVERLRITSVPAKPNTLRASLTLQQLLAK